MEVFIQRQDGHVLASNVISLDQSRAAATLAARAWSEVSKRAPRFRTDCTPLVFNASPIE